MLNDGTLGLFEVARRGGISIAQDPADATYPDMPKSAAENVALDYSPRLADMPKLLFELTSGRDAKEKAMPITALQSDVGPEPEMIDARRFERPVAITCPECGGAHISEVGTITKFGCHIGHSYTAEIMAVAHLEKMERVMREAVRFLNERAESAFRWRSTPIRPNRTSPHHGRRPAVRSLIAHISCGI